MVRRSAQGRALSGSQRSQGSFEISFIDVTPGRFNMSGDGLKKRKEGHQSGKYRPLLVLDGLESLRVCLKHLSVGLVALKTSIMSNSMTLEMGDEKLDVHVFNGL